jgi:replicative DNA helicase
MSEPQAQPSERRRHNTGLRVIEGGMDSAFAVRPPPHSIEAEEYLLSCCLLDGGDTLGKCQEAKLQPAAFYLPANRVIYERLCELQRKSPPVTIEMLIEDLRSGRLIAAVGGVPYLMQVSARIPTTAQAQYFIAKLRELWLLREAIKEGMELVERSFGWTGGELGEQFGSLAAKFSRMADYAAGRHEGTMALRAAAAQEHGAKLMSGKIDTSRWLRTGLPYVDGKLTPFDETNEDWLIVLASEPSGGKSSLASQIARFNLAQGKRGAIFQLETGDRMWLLRAAAAAAGVNLRDLVGEMPEHLRLFEDWQKKLAEWCAPAGQRLWIFDDIFHIDQICAKVRQLKREAGLDFIVVDYLQLVTPNNLRATREQQVAEISRKLKLLAKTCHLPAFVPSQLNRAGRAEDRPPRLSDLRESGAIEQDADRVIAIYTPKQDDTGLSQDLNADRLYVQLHQLKNRNGPVGWVWTQFTRRTTRFDDVPHKHQGAPGSPKPGEGYKRHRN